MFYCPRTGPDGLFDFGFLFLPTGLNALFPFTIQERHDIRHIPQPIRDASSHS